MSDKKVSNAERDVSTPNGDKPAPGGEIQGEGDYVSGRRYQKAAETFAKQHDTEQLARDAAPRDVAEQQELLDAEQKGRARAKGKKRKNPPDSEVDAVMRETPKVGSRDAPGG